MSAFKLDYKDFDFTIILDSDPDHSPIERWHIVTDEDKELLSDGTMAYFNLCITSSKESNDVDHFIPGVLLPVDQEEQAEDLEYILLEDGLLDEIIDHWVLRESQDIKPTWATK